MSNTTQELFRANTHPRLFFGPGDLSALREKVVADTVSKRTFAEILRRCERYADPRHARYVNPTVPVSELLRGFGGGAMNDTGDAAHCFAFAYALTGDERWAAAGIALLRAFVGPPDTLMQVCYSTLANNLTLVFDLCYDRLSGDDIAATERYLRERIVHYEKTFLLAPGKHHFGLGGNTFWRSFEKYVLMLAATWRPGEDDARLPVILGFLRRSIHRGADEGGTLYEGPGYGWRDLEWLSYMAEVLYRLGAADLWREEPRFSEIARNWSYLVLPGGYGQNNYCDASRKGCDRPLLGVLLAARRLNDPVLQWTWEQLGGRDSTRGGRPVPTSWRYGLGQSILWDGDGHKAVSPGDAGQPDARCSGRAGIAISRSDWADDALYCSLLASKRDSSTFVHQHVDSGHLSLYALGEAFSVDSGYGDIKGCYHSVMMPNAQEPSTAPTGFGQMFFGGEMDLFAAGRGADYARVDSACQWECHWAYRHMLHVKGPGAAPYVVLLDNMNHGPDLICYRWQLNSEPGNQIECDAEADRAVIHGKQHRLEVAWCYPSHADYSPSHWLDLSAVTIKGSPRGGPGVSKDVNGQVVAKYPHGGWTTGLGERPQLIADLWGVNGVLLTALIPRTADSATVEIERVNATDQLGLVIHHGNVTDTVIGSPQHREIELDGISGEASLVVVRRDNAGHLLWWAAADAYALFVDGDNVLPREGTPKGIVTAPILEEDSCQKQSE